MATALVIGGVGALVNFLSGSSLAAVLASLGLPSGILASLAVATIGPPVLGYGVRQLVLEPIWAGMKAVLPVPGQVLVNGVEALTRTAFVLIGTGKAISTTAKIGMGTTKLLAGAAYVVVSGAVSGATVVIRLAGRHTLGRSIDTLQYLASASPANKDASPVQSITYLQTTKDTDTLMKEFVMISENSSDDNHSSSDDDDDNLPPSPPSSHASLVPDDSELPVPVSGSVDGSITDMAPYLSVASSFSAAGNNQSAAASSSSATTDEPQVNWDEWCFVKQSMSGEDIEQARKQLSSSLGEVNETDTKYNANEAVAQCSYPALSRLIGTLEDDVAEVLIFENNDDALERPKYASITELKDIISSANASVTQLPSASFVASTQQKSSDSSSSTTTTTTQQQSSNSSSTTTTTQQQSFNSSSTTTQQSDATLTPAS